METIENILRRRSVKMNKVILMGRLVRDPNITYTAGDEQTMVARYTLAVNRRTRKAGDDQSADFINCVVFGRGAEFADSYLRRGIKIVVEGRIQTGSYTNKEGRKVYTTDVFVEYQEFAESRAANQQNGNGQGVAPQRPDPAKAGDGFMDVPEGAQEELPFLP